MFALSLFQVKWSGKVIDGAGRSTGETTELANSYLSRLGPVTRHMTKQGMLSSNLFTCTHMTQL